MLGDISGVEHIYLACGYTDLRRGIDGLAQLVQQQFSLDPFSNSLFLFCGRRCDRIKALLWEGDGFVLLYKRIEHGGFQWPRTAQEMPVSQRPAPVMLAREAARRNRRKTDPLPCTLLHRPDIS